MKKIITIVLNMSLMISMIIPIGIVEGMAGHPTSVVEITKAESGLFRTTVLIEQEYDLTRLEKLGVTILEQNGDQAAVLVTESQLESLARLGFEPSATNDLALMVNTNAESGSWLANSLKADLSQATTIMSLNRTSEEVKIDTESELKAVIENFSIEQLSGIQSLPGVDNDADGLTDTQESWWCTDPNNADSDGDGVTDGEEIQTVKDWVANRLPGPSYDTPWASWPFNTTTCPDKDFDSIPNLVEKWELGLNMDVESTDRDKFDDGQEVFGVTNCPGGDLNCGYGDLPRSNDSGYVGQTMPSWVKAPGSHPLISAFPYPEIDVIPSSLMVETVTTITTNHVINSGTEISYSTSKTEGLNTSVANSVTWNEWQEIAESYEERLFTNNLRSSNPLSDSEWNTWGVVGGGLSIVGGIIGGVAGCVATVGIGCPLAIAGAVAAVGAGAASIIDAAPDDVQSDLQVNQYNNNEEYNYNSTLVDIDNVQTTVTNQSFDTENVVKAIQGTQYAYDQMGEVLNYRLYQIANILSTPTHTSSTSEGSSWGGSQTTTTEEYEEHTITNGETLSSEESWGIATAVDSSHVADFWFSYRVKNSGTEYAREIGNITFNVYLNDDPNPITTYFVSTDIGGEGVFRNFLPNESHTFTSQRIPLTLEQMKKIDLGGTLRVVIEDFSFGSDEYFYDDALAGNIQVVIEDSILDGTENADRYLIPTYPGDMVTDVLARYFPHLIDSKGNLIALWTPEYRQDIPNWCLSSRQVGEGINTALWCKHAISVTDWWSIYTNKLGDGSLSLSEMPAINSGLVFIKFNADSDLDGYSDRSEIKLNTDPYDSSDFPYPNLLAGVHSTQNGNEVVSTLSLLNSGLYDSYGIEAIMIAPDDSITITNNTVGGSGRVRSGKEVIVGSKILPPSYTSETWLGSAQPVSGGYYLGTTDETYSFTIVCNMPEGCIIGQDEFSFNWTNGGGINTLIFPSDYQSPMLLNVGTDGLMISMLSGKVYNNNSFTIETQKPQDTFRYTINREPYSQPIIIVSYNDPQGNHRFIIPSGAMELTTPTEDLFNFSNQMIDMNGVEIVSSRPVIPGINNLSLVATNPSGISLQQANLHLKFIDSQGFVVNQEETNQDIPIGPNIVDITWNTSNFVPEYNPDENYTVLAYWTDYAGNILDVSGRSLSNFQEDPIPDFSTNFEGGHWDFGIAQKGTSIETELTIANTGFNNLWAWSGQGEPVPLRQASTVDQLKPGEMKIIPLILDTSSLPLGEYNGILPLRTNDPNNPVVNIQVTGTIIDPTDSVTSQSNPYQPLNENIRINGPQAENSILSYAPAEDIQIDAQPVLFTDPTENIAGKGEAFLDLGNEDVLVLNQVENKSKTDFSDTGDVLDPLFSDREDLKGAIELEEYRTEFSSVYVWPDGRGVAFSILPSDEGDVQLNDAYQGSVRYDTYVNAYYPSSTNTTESRLYIGNSTTYYKSNARTLIRFNLPSLPTYSEIDSALFHLYEYSYCGTNTIGTQVYRVTSDWSESSYPTWNSQPSVDWGTVWSTLDIPKSVGSRYWNITGLTRAWYSGTPNYGLLLRANPENANCAVFYSKENGSNVPYMQVTFHLTPPPSAPTLYAISNSDGDGSFTVDWNTVTNTTGYELQESFNSGTWNLIYSTASSVYSATGRSAGSWCYRVRAVNAYGTSSWSSTQCTTVNPPPGTPVINEINNPEADGDYAVDWNVLPITSSYELQENYNSGSFSTIYTGTSNSYSISGRGSGQWCYRAKAINASGSSEWSATLCTIVNLAPNVPIRLLPTSNTTQLGRLVTFSWQDGGDGDNYPNTPRQYMVEIASSEFDLIESSGWITDTQWAAGLPTDGNFTWRVQASDGLSTSSWSDYQNLTNYSIARISADQIQIALPKSVEEATSDSYQVKYGIEASFSTANIPKTVYVDLPKRLYSSVTMAILVNESSVGNVDFSLDVAADGTADWNQSFEWNSPVIFESPNLAYAINEYMSQSPVVGGTLVSIPIRINFNSTGHLYLMNVDAAVGIDSDPMLDVGDIIVSDTNPVETENITLTARVHNAGLYAAKNVMVNYFVGNPSEGGRYIGSNLVPSVLAGNYVDTSLEWDTSGFTGNQEIFTILDMASQISEMDEENNTSSLSISIRTRPDLTTTSFELSDNEPVVGETVDLIITETNQGEADASSSIVSVYADDPQNDGLLLSEGAVEVMGDSSTNLEFSWTPDRTGWHRLFVISDKDNQVSEFNESNNQNWLDVYVGVSGPILLDSGTASDTIYSIEEGFGYIDINQPDELAVCGLGNLPEETIRRDPDGEIVYQFDHLQPGHYYHLDVTLYECDGAGRQQTVFVDGNQISGIEDLGDGQIHRLSLRLDPALYNDRTVLVSIQSEGIDGAVISSVNLHDVDYRYADAGGGYDPQYPGDLDYGWVDGTSVLTWGTLPYKSVRVDQSDNAVRYEFDNLNPERRYNIHFTFWQPSGTARIQKVQIDDLDTGLTVNTGDYQIHQEKIAVLQNSYSADGKIVVSIVRTNASTGAMINEIALEEETISTNTECVVNETPYFSETYGNVLIEDINAPAGSVVQAVSPRGDTVGCFTVTNEGQYGFMRIYGEDTSAVPSIPGMRAGEMVSFKVNGSSSVASPLFYWNDDHTAHNINLNAGNINGQSILMQPGWNLISFNVEPPAPIVSSVLQSINGRYDRVLSEYGVYVPSLSDPFNTLRELHSANGYYLRLTGTTSVSLLVEGILQSCDEPKELHTGWNWIGAPCSITPIETALQSIDGYYQRVLSLDKTYDPALPLYSTLNDMIPGEGYLIFITDVVTLLYPAESQPDVFGSLEKSSVCENVAPTPFSTLVYGEVHFGDRLAPEGYRIEFVTPEGDVAGCAVIEKNGLLPLTHIYGADNDGTPGFSEGQVISLRVNGISSNTPLNFTWQDDKTPHLIQPEVEGYNLYLPSITN